MNFMFSAAKSFDADISKWDVVSVKSMDRMFSHATSFKQKLCGDAWVQSKASQGDMFDGSYGSILTTSCTTGPAIFSPQSEHELKSAVDAYLKLSSKGDCS